MTRHTSTDPCFPVHPPSWEVPSAVWTHTTSTNIARKVLSGTDAVGKSRLLRRALPRKMQKEVRKKERKERMLRMGSGQRRKWPRISAGKNEVPDATL